MARVRKRNRRLTRPLEGWLAWAFVRTLSARIRRLPHSALGRRGDLLGDFCYRTMPRYRRVALANLRRAFGDHWDEARIAATAQASFRHLGRTLVEFLWMPRLTPASLRDLVSVSGLEHLEEGLSAGRGVVLFSAHYGNWEIMPARLTEAGFRLHTVFRESEHGGLNRLISEMRRRSGQRLLPRRNAMRPALAALRRNEVFAVLLDQNTLRGGLFVPFFGIPASTAAGPASLSVRTGAPMAPLFVRRLPDGTHEMTAHPLIHPDPGAEVEAEVLRLTAAATRSIEGQVRECPEQWLWIHHRWKLRPDGTKLA